MGKESESQKEKVRKKLNQLNLNNLKIFRYHLKQQQCLEVIEVEMVQMKW